jgi:2-polyprenyl-3-methyl-5-hydroxy-6-metoxy-1,4-benzoquinol methylase
MTTTDDRPGTDVDLARVEAFAARMGGDLGIAANAVLAYLGDRLGLWRTLASMPATTSEDLAERTGLDERYLREWLATQAAAGYVEYDPATRTFTLPAEHALVLAHDDSPVAMAGGFEFVASGWAIADRLANAFATGEGIGWHTHDPRLWSAVDRNFRPFYTNSLVPEWLPALDGVVDKLRAGARVLDVGCGLGTATLLMAEAFPASTFVGVDYHEESVRRATAAAARAGVSDRVTFRTGQAGTVGADGERYDLICFFDAIHDLGDPVGALRAARSALTADGTVLAVEPNAADALEGNLHPGGLYWYASSMLVCLPGSLSQPGAAGLGAQAGPARLTEVFREAGYGTAHVAATAPFHLVLEGRA